MGTKGLDAIREVRITEPTYYRWRKQRDLVRHWSEGNGRVRDGSRPIQGTQTAAELQPVKQAIRGIVCQAGQRAAASRRFGSDPRQAHSVGGRKG